MFRALQHERTDSTQALRHFIITWSVKRETYERFQVRKSGIPIYITFTGRLLVIAFEVEGGSA